MQQPALWRMSKKTAKRLFKSTERKIFKELESWMLTKGFESIDAFKGTMSQQHISDPTGYERANYIKILESQK